MVRGVEMLCILSGMGLQIKVCLSGRLRTWSLGVGLIWKHDTLGTAQCGIIQLACMHLDV